MQHDPFYSNATEIFGALGINAGHTREPTQPEIFEVSDDPIPVIYGNVTDNEGILQIDEQGFEDIINESSEDFPEGLRGILEEVNELIEAVEENSNTIHEAADVLYHLLMYLEANNVKVEEIMEELSSRKK